MKIAIRCLEETERHEIQETVRYACSVWPNDGSEDPPRVMLHRAFAFLRYEMIERRLSVSAAAGELYSYAYKYEDM